MVRVIGLKQLKVSELRDILLLSITMAFVATFRAWDYLNLLYNFVIVFALITVSVYVQKAIAAKMGADAEFDLRWEHMVIMVLAAFISNGIVPILLMPAIKVTPYFGRIGYKYSSLALGEKSIIHAGAALALIGISIFSKPLALLGSPASSITLLSASMAFFSMLPFPTISGLEIFMSNRMAYFILFFDSILLLALGSVDFFVTFGSILITTVVLFFLGNKLGL